MKKYSKPTMKFHTVKLSSIITGSNDTFSIDPNKTTTADQLGKERGGFFDEEEGLSW